ncbi:hypothetical protein RKD45_003848 [Streptomyces griseus]|nr:hypothetical protein [Streptomyces pratensis]
MPQDPDSDTTAVPQAVTIRARRTIRHHLPRGGAR